MKQALTRGKQKGRSRKMPSVDYSWQMGVIGIKIINVWLLPAFPIHQLAQEESCFSMPFLPFLQPPRRPLPCQFHSVGSHNQEWKIDKRAHNQRGRRRPVPLLLEYKGIQQSSGKPNTQAENSFLLLFLFFFKSKAKLDSQNQKLKEYPLQGVAQHHCNLDININYIHWLVGSGLLW